MLGVSTTPEKEKEGEGGIVLLTSGAVQSELADRDAHAVCTQVALIVVMAVVVVLVVVIW